MVARRRVLPVYDGGLLRCFVPNTSIPTRAVSETARVCAALVVFLLPVTGCTESPSTLLVDIRTELVANVEFDLVRTEVLSGEGSGRFVEHEYDAVEDYTGGARVAEIDALPRGAVTVRVTLLLDGAEVIQRPVRVTLTAPLQAVTLLLPRDCLGVMCPVADGDPTASACVGGTCQDERCTEETPEFCEPECEAASDCAGGSTCASAECSASGSCFLSADDLMCAPRQTCHVADGCIADDPCAPFPGTDLELHVTDHAACVYASDEPLRCWGDNSTVFGEPYETPVESPREVLPGMRLRNFALGAAYLCGVDDTAVARCLGADWAGQLGDSIDASPTEMLVSVVGLPGPVDTLRAGFATTCATVSGDPYCWGANEAGQVGHGSSGEVWVPVRVGGDAVLRDVVPGQTHTCGLTPDNKLYCWGTNSSGELGTPTAMLDSAALPFPVGLADGWATVSLGSGFTLALNDLGELHSWGANFAGQLGRVTTGEENATPGRVDGDLAAATADAGWAHGCLITTEGALYCWGDATWGQVGPNGPSGDGLFQPGPVPVMPERRFVGVGAGMSHTCALDDTGRVWCWGDNSRAQLARPVGDGSQEPWQVCLSE